MDTEGVSTSGGRYVELGFALAQGKYITIIGPDNQRMFNSLANNWFNNWDDFFRVL